MAAALKTRLVMESGRKDNALLKVEKNDDSKFISKCFRSVAINEYPKPA